MRAIALGSLVLWFGLAGALRAETPSVAALPSERLKPVADEGPLKGNRQIRLDLKIGELSITEMRRQGIDFPNLFMRQKQQDRQKAAGTVAMLTRSGALKILAEPSLIVADGRPAFFQSGPTVAGRKTGSQIELTAQLLDNDRIKLDLVASQTDVDPSLSVATRGGMAPGFRHSSMAPSFEMDLGQTTIFAGMAESKTQSVTDPRTRRRSNVQVQTQMLYFVTPQLLAPAE
jgi:Bacterial type II and III secretion system protein